jgi:glycopeptide antibiotics resistance protein
MPGDHHSIQDPGHLCYLIVVLYLGGTISSASASVNWNCRLPWLCSLDLRQEPFQSLASFSQCSQGSTWIAFGYLCF